MPSPTWTTEVLTAPSLLSAAEAAFTSSSAVSPLSASISP